MTTSVCVCLCDCLSVREDISRNTWVIFTNFSVHVAYITVARCSSGRVMKSQGEGAILGFSSPLTMHYTV